jgi:hypothetical protein
MDISFLILRWLIIFITFFLLGFSISMVIGYFVMVWKDKRQSKQLIEDILKYRK